MTQDAEKTNWDELLSPHPLQSIHISECPLKLGAEMCSMFKCKAAREKVTDNWIYKERTCTSSLKKQQQKLGRCSWGCKQHKQSHTERRKRLHTPLTSFSLSAIQWVSIYDLLCVLGRAGVCMCTSMCVSARERETETCLIYTYACQLVAQGRLLACLTRDD